MNGSDDMVVNRLPIDGTELWKGCILASCVHGVMLTEFPFTLKEHTWSGGLYVTENGEGKAALIFSEEKGLLLGMFWMYFSERTELVLTDQYARSHYKGAPAEIQEMAETLAELFEDGEGDKKLPYVTTGFWQENGQILSRDAYEDWLAHGGYLLQHQMEPFEEAMPYYEDVCSMDEPRMEIAERLYRERIQSPGQQVVLTKEEQAVLQEAEPRNMEVCQEVFEAFGVVFA